MNEDASFSARIRAAFPEGLTGIFAVGGTRTSYILEHNRQQAEPGKIADLSDYADDILDGYFNLIDMFLSLGGQNIIITILSYDRFTARGEAYAEFISQSTLMLINEKSVQFYRDHDIDPYFVGIDTLLQLPTSDSAHKLGAELAAFQQSWPYKPGHFKLVWEVAAIPLFSFWKAQETIGETGRNEINKAMADATDMDAVVALLYKFYSSAVYGTDMPTPHFYLGTNRNGDLKIRSLIPISLLCGGSFRLFYTPYPTLFVSRNTLKNVLENLAFPKAILRSLKTDYKDQYSSEIVEAEYQRVVQLSNDPDSTVGLTRTVLGQDSN